VTATYEICRHPGCGNWQRVDILGDICTSCGRLMVGSRNDTSAEPVSPIVARRVFQSASLRRADLAAGTQTL